jgi:hypothetical protein
MNGQENSNKNERRGNWKSQNPGVRRAGYIVAIIVMIVMLYVLDHLREWGVPFLTPDFDRCLFYIKLAIYVSIGSKALFIIYDHKWFRHLAEVIVNAANALSIIMVYVIFPFDFTNPNWIKWLKIGLLIIFIITIISIIVELVKGIRYLVKDTEAV